MANIKITFSIDEKILAVLDRLARDAVMSRSGLISLMVMAMSNISKEDFLEAREFSLRLLSASVKKGRLMRK